ncbi:unnamed protein product [Pleuronectes platessa]|uniref:Uncharacterized protein n=1 Tax=Pleuronectes platessa TaxID=8262 RepID=A0A9N7VLB3_PLEPL|nr:unnamed protein product [Pleuronectes platessa]
MGRIARSAISLLADLTSWSPGFLARLYKQIEIHTTEGLRAAGATGATPPHTRQLTLSAAHSRQNASAMRGDPGGADAQAVAGTIMAITQTAHTRMQEMNSKQLNSHQRNPIKTCKDRPALCDSAPEHSPHVTLVPEQNRPERQHLYLLLIRRRWRRKSNRDTDENSRVLAGPEEDDGRSRLTQDWMSRLGSNTSTC